MQIENNNAKVELIKKALAEHNKELPPEMLDKVGKSFVTTVDVG